MGPCTMLMFGAHPDRFMGRSAVSIYKGLLRDCKTDDYRHSERMKEVVKDGPTSLTHPTLTESTPNRVRAHRRGTNSKEC